MKNNIDGLKEFQKLIRNLEKRETYLSGLNNTIGDETMLTTTHLHQSDENMSEEQSAKFEVENPRVFKVIQGVFEELKRITKP